MGRRVYIFPRIALRWSILIVTIGQWLTSEALLCQTETSSYRVEVSAFGARGEAMGQALAADAMDAQSMFYNPASLVFRDSFSGVVNVFRRVDNSILVGNAVVSIPFDGFAFGLGGEYRAVGENSVSPSLYVHAAHAGFSVKITKTFGFGVLGSLYRGSTSGRRVYAFLAGVGMFYAPVPGLRYGVSFQGIGSGLGFREGEQSTLDETRDIPKRLTIGLAMTFPRDRPERVADIALTSEKIFGERGFIYHAGLEVLPVKFLALRGGFIVGTSGNLPQAGGATVGMGLRAPWISLDYSLSPSKSLEKHHQISLSLGGYPSP